MKVIENKHFFEGELRAPRPSAAYQWDGQMWVLDNAKQAELLAQYKQKLCKQVDIESEEVCQKFIGTVGRMAEYALTAAEAQAYKDANYRGIPAPAVKSWADAKQYGYQHATETILARVAIWEQMLYSIRDIRLKGKEVIRQASDEHSATAQAQGVFEKFNDILDTLAPKSTDSRKVVNQDFI